MRTRHIAPFSANLLFSRVPAYLLLSAGIGLASAQQTTASLVGDVVDATGAAVVGATVTVTNSGTGIARSTTSDNEGKYSLPSLPPGTYSLSITMASFKKEQVNGIVLDASQTARQDFKLSPGEISNFVEVQASSAAAQLQTENGAVGQVIDGKKIVDLPLNGRNFVQLAQLIPGVNTGTSGSITVRRNRGALASSDANGGSTSIQVNGQRDTQNRYSIDGIEDMDYDAFTFAFSPSVDAMAEFRVDTSSSGVDSGAASGANVNQIIKSGTNRVHGTLFYFNRNNAFTQYYDAIAHKSLVSPRLNRNQFGGNVGGPVWIPKVYNGKGKTFFFFNVETGDLLTATTPTPTSVPSAAVRSGNIDELISGAASNCLVNTKASCVLVNPYTQQPFVLGQRITVDPKAAIILNTTPTPNITTGTTTNYVTPTLKTLNYQHDYIGRVDHTINTHDSLSGHIIHDVTYSNGAPFFGNDNDNNRALTTHYVISETHIFSPRLVNEFRYGRSIFKEFETFPSTNNPALNIANGQLGIPFSSPDPQFFGPPNVAITNVGTTYRLFNNLRDIGPRNRANGINQYVDSLSWQTGKHFLKFGVDIGRRTDFFTQARDPRGHFTFDGRYTGGRVGSGLSNAAGAGLLDFLLGYVATDSINPTVTQTHIVSLIQAYSMQDNWSVSKNLTLNLGVRWDHFPPWYQQDNRFADIFAGPDGITPGAIQTASTSPFGRGIIQSYYHDFAPRIGFAYQPEHIHGMVIRGGYGLYFTPDIANGYFQEAEGFQAQAGASLTGSTGFTAGLGAAQPTLTLSNPFPGVSSNPTSAPTYPFAVEIVQNLSDQLTQQFNLTVQKTIGYKMTAEAAYVGALGTHNFTYYPDVNLPRPVNPNTPGLASVNARRPNQTFARTVQGETSNGSSSYHSLQTKLERRVGQGLNILVSYTWSKSISGPADVGGLVGGGFYGATALDPLNPEADRSLSVFDIPHRFVGTVLYDVPFFQHTTGLKRVLLDGFQVSTIVSAVSGDPSQVTYGGATVNASSQAARPDVVFGQAPNLPRGQRTFSRVFNTAAFTTPRVGTFGNSRRTGAIRLPGLLNEDLSVTKGLKFGEGTNFQLRADFFNLWKHYNPDPSTITTNIVAANYGKINDGLSGGYASRIIQLGAKFYF